MFEIITAIALWCGPPVYSGQFGLPDRSKKEVQECRDRLLKCTGLNPTPIFAYDCFLKEKLK